MLAAENKYLHGISLATLGRGQVYFVANVTEKNWTRGNGCDGFHQLERVSVAFHSWPTPVDMYRGRKRERDGERKV